MDRAFPTNLGKQMTICASAEKYFPICKEKRWVFEDFWLSGKVEVCQNSVVILAAQCGHKVEAVR